MTSMGDRSTRIAAIQMLRAVAATAVVVYHASLIGNDYSKHQAFAPIAEPGKFGVNLFFVLSGFIICFAHSKDVGRPETLGRYAWRRFTRIYPAYWLFSIFYVIAAVAGIGQPDFTWDPLNIVSGIVLVKLTDPVTLPLQVGWTLLYEMRFYVLFASFLISRRLGIALFGLWTLYIAASFVTGIKDPINLWAPWNLHFLLGCLLFLLYRRTPAVAGLPLILIGLAGVLFAAVTTDFDLTPLEGRNLPLMILLAFTLSALVLGCLALESRIGWFSSAPVLLLGNASYSIYLVHSAIISLIFIVARKLGFLKLAPIEAWFFLAVIAGITGGVLAYLWVERPMLALIRRAGSLSSRLQAEPA